MNGCVVSFDLAFGSLCLVVVLVITAHAYSAQLGGLTAGASVTEGLAAGALVAEGRGAAQLVAKIPEWRVVLDLTFGSLCLRARGRTPRIALSDGRAEHAAGSTP